MEHYDLMHSFTGKYFQDTLVINGRVEFICSRSSGPLDCTAKWWSIDGKYQLKWIAYHEDIIHISEHGTLLQEVRTIQDVLTYCCTHLHPDL